MFVSVDSNNNNNNNNTAFYSAYRVRGYRGAGMYGIDSSNSNNDSN